MSQPLPGKALLYRTDPVSLQRYRLLLRLFFPEIFRRSDQQYRSADMLQGSEDLSVQKRQLLRLPKVRS